jgi:hypothetical protein
MEKFQKEMGATAKEDRMDAYMKAATRDGVTMLNPTSDLPVSAEKVTVTKTWKFGLGQACSDVIDKVAACHSPHDTALIPVLVPRKLLNASGAEQSPNVHAARIEEAATADKAAKDKSTFLDRIRKPSKLEQRVSQPTEV